MSSKSILNTVKEDVGIFPDDQSFDDQLIRDINTALFLLYQIGVGDKEFEITSTDETWTDFQSAVGLTDSRIEEAKRYVSNRVKQFFDPEGMTSSVNSALNEQNRELEWRLNSKYDREKERLDE